MLKLSRIRYFKKLLKNKIDDDGFTCDNKERAIINVGAENYDDIFSAFCYKGGDTLSRSLVEYLDQKASAVPLDYDLTIRFHVKNATEEKRREIKNALRENYQSDIHGIERRMNRTTIFSMWFVLVGIIFTILYLCLGDLVPVAVSYIIDILAWVFLWEGIDAFFLDRRTLMIDNIKAYRLCAANIEIVEFEPY